MHFRVDTETEYAQKYTVRHVHSGQGAGGFWYKRHALAAAKAMSEAAEAFLELTTIMPAGHAFSREALLALEAARKPHKDADTDRAKLRAC